MSLPRPQVVIYTDGACKGNPGPGGWGAWLRSGEHEKELFGGEAGTTNNRMEPTAVIESLASLKRNCDVFGYTEERRTERALIGEYEALVDEVSRQVKARAATSAGAVFGTSMPATIESSAESGSLGAALAGLPVPVRWAGSSRLRSASCSALPTAFRRSRSS